MAVTDEAIILAGGFGTRLQSMVKDVPKPLAPVAGRPFLAWLLDMLADQGIRRVILATGYLAEAVEAAIGSRWRSMAVVYSVEDMPLGTGGAIARALGLVQGNSAIVLNGDTYLRLDYRRLSMWAEHSGKDICMGLAHVDDVARYGAVHVEGGVVRGFVEKGQAGPGWINAGVYWLGGSVSTQFPQERTFSFEERMLVPAVLRQGVAAYTETSEFIDIGVPDDYLRAQADFESRR